MEATDVHSRGSGLEVEQARRGDAQDYGMRTSDRRSRKQVRKDGGDDTFLSQRDVVGAPLCVFCRDVWATPHPATGLASSEL